MGKTEQSTSVAVIASTWINGWRQHEPCEKLTKTRYIGPSTPRRPPHLTIRRQQNSRVGYQSGLVDGQLHPDWQALVHWLGRNCRTLSWGRRPGRRFCVVADCH